MAFAYIWGHEYVSRYYRSSFGDYTEFSFQSISKKNEHTQRFDVNTTRSRDSTVPKT